MLIEASVGVSGGTGEGYLSQVKGKEWLPALSIKELSDMN